MHTRLHTGSAISPSRADPSSTVTPTKGKGSQKGLDLASSQELAPRSGELPSTDAPPDGSSKPLDFQIKQKKGSGVSRGKRGDGGARMREKHGGKTVSKKSQRAAKQKHAPTEPATVRNLELGAGTGRFVGPVVNMLAHKLFQPEDASKPMTESHPEYSKFKAFKEDLDYVATEYSQDRSKFLKTTATAKEYGVDAYNLPAKFDQLDNIISVNPYGYGTTLKNAKDGAKAHSIDHAFFESVTDRLSDGGSLFLFCKSNVLKSFGDAIGKKGDWQDSVKDLSGKELRTLTSQFVAPHNDSINPYADLTLDQLREVSATYNLEIEVERTHPPQGFTGGAPDTNDRDLAPFNVQIRFRKVPDDEENRGVRFICDKPRRGSGYHTEEPGGILTDWVKPKAPE